jgi:hypothetical protein
MSTSAAIPSVPCNASEELPNTVIDNVILDAIEKAAILVYSRPGEAHLHSNCHSSSTINTAAWLYREVSPLGSSKPNGQSKSSMSHFAEPVTAQAPFNQTARLAVHSHS